MTVLVKIAFDGTNYHGFQIQENAVTIFSIFQDALIKIIGHKTDIKGCSRTDSGVHAKCYYLSFETEKPLNLHKFPLSMNANLPMDIRVLSAQQAEDGFHARYDAKGKQYTYNILNSHVDDPFTMRYYYRVPTPLDCEKMNEAAQYFVGKHDFCSFMTQRSKIINCTRTVYCASVTRQAEQIKFVISADGYLYNMVRIMTGTLIKAGLGKIKPQEIESIISAHDRSKAGVTVPAKGLFLTDVFY